MLNLFSSLSVRIAFGANESVSCFDSALLYLAAIEDFLPSLHQMVLWFYLFWNSFFDLKSPECPSCGMIPNLFDLYHTSQSLAGDCWSRNWLLLSFYFLLDTSSLAMCSTIVKKWIRCTQVTPFKPCYLSLAWICSPLSLAALLLFNERESPVQVNLQEWAGPWVAGVEKFCYKRKGCESQNESLEIDTKSGQINDGDVSSQIMQ